jgi:hypothetical protein
VNGLTIDDAALDAHVLTPSHIENVRSYRGLDDEPELRELLAPPPGTTPLAPSPLGTTPQKHLDVNGFGTALHAALKSEVVGYCMCLRKNGETIYTLEWNWAETPADAGIGWTPDRQMHVASVSKLITAMALTKLLDDKGIPYTAKIIDYLPDYWAKGPNINQISFQNLMTQTSGFSTTNGQTDFASMKAKVAAGVASVGSYRYENMNFGLCRILTSIVNGTIGKAAELPDQWWDYVTIHGYKNHVSAKVLAPAGASGATLEHAAGAVLAYPFPVSGKGWNSGSLDTVSGGAGWHFTVKQLLDVMSKFRHTTAIMPAAKAQGMLDHGFGIDVIMGTPAGTLYNKNGLWMDGAGRTEQSLAYFLPEGMELVVLANSPVGSPGKFFRKVVTDIYLAHLV